MTLLAQLFILIDLLTLLVLLVMLTRNSQDTAGKAMLLLPIVLTGAIATGAWFLLRARHAGWSAVVAGLPAILIIYMVYLHSRANKQE